MLRHADRLTIGCQAQLVNIIAPIRTQAGGPAWRQTIFHPFAHTARLAKGTVLQAAVTSPTMPTGRFGDVPAVDAVATRDEETGALAVFVVNRSLEPITLEMDLRAFPRLGSATHIALAEDDRNLMNTMDAPERVALHHHTGGGTTVSLPPVSWHAFSFEEQK
jgi:alpha-N-arabinofuranosidase